MRGCLLAFGAILAAGGVLLVVVGVTSGIPSAIVGIVIVGAVLIERWRYRAVETGRPGPGWQQTGERFVDPETGRLVTVFYREDTGERRYVSS